MKAETLRDELKGGGALQSVLQSYAHALFTQVSQSAACVSSHAVAKRLSLWLVMTHDHAPGDESEMKDEPSQLASGHSLGEETLAASVHPTARLLTPMAAPSSITEGTTRHLQTLE